MNDSKHPSLDVADYDADGDLDIVTGNYVIDPQKLGTLKYWVTLFENLARE